MRKSGPIAWRRGALGLLVALALPQAAAARLTANDVATGLFSSTTESVAAGQPGSASDVCPAHYLALAGGANWYDPGPDGHLGSVTPTEGGGLMGWYADAYNPTLSPHNLAISMTCVPEQKLAKAVFATKRVLVQPGKAGEATAACPDGMRVLGGGAYWTLPGGGLDATNARYAWLSSFGPRGHGRKWYANGFNESPNLLRARRLTVLAWCLPEGKLAGYRYQPPAKPLSILGGPITSTSDAPCGDDSYALAGGALWAKAAGGGPKAGLAKHTELLNSFGLSTGHTWQVRAHLDPSKTLTLAVPGICLDPV